MLCETCDKRESCVELCAEAEAFVNQDYIPIAHQTPTAGYTIDYFNDEETVWDYSQNRPLPKGLKKLIRQLHKDGLSYRKIEYHLGVDKAYISRVLTKS